MKIECPEEEDTERRVSAIILLISGAFNLFDIIDIFMGVSARLSYLWPIGHAGSWWPY